MMSVYGAGDAAPSVDVDRFRWLIDRFVTETPGVEHAAVVSTDGLLLTYSADFPTAHADQLAAVASGLHGLADSAAGLAPRGGVEQLLVFMTQGRLLLSAIGEGAVLAVLAAARADLQLIGFQMRRLVDDATHVLTAPVRDQLLHTTQDG